MIAIVRVDDVDGDKPITHELGSVMIPMRLLKEQTVEHWLNDRWAEWREEVPFPDSYTLFVKWLIEKHGCKLQEDTYVCTFDVR